MKAFYDYRAGQFRGYKEQIAQETPDEVKETEVYNDNNIDELAKILKEVPDPLRKMQVTKEYWLAKLNEQKYLENEKRLVPTEQVAREAAQLATIVKQRLYVIPNKVAPLCYGKEMAEIKDILLEAINEAIEDLHVNRKKWKEKADKITNFEEI